MARAIDHQCSTPTTRLESTETSIFDAMLALATALVPPQRLDLRVLKPRLHQLTSLAFARVPPQRLDLRVLKHQRRPMRAIRLRVPPQRLDLRVLKHAASRARPLICSRSTPTTRLESTETRDTRRLKHLYAVPPQRLDLRVLKPTGSAATGCSAHQRLFTGNDLRAFRTSNAGRFLLAFRPESATIGVSLQAGRWLSG